MGLTSKGTDGANHPNRGAMPTISDAQWAKLQRDANAAEPMSDTEKARLIGLDQQTYSKRHQN